jgi:hypothetical protein
MNSFFLTMSTLEAFLASLAFTLAIAAAGSLAVRLLAALYRKLL